jgi:anti-anti-sigma regulatory factor
MEQINKVTTTTRANVGVIELCDDITVQAEEAVTESFQKLEKDGVEKFLFKFNEATYINSSGLGIVNDPASKTS